MTGRLGVGVAAALVVTALVAYVTARVSDGLSIWVVAALLWGGAAVAIALAIPGGRKDQPAPLKARARALALALVPCVALLPGIVAVLTSPRLQMSFHGYLHSAYAYQALEGNLPPENPMLAGTPGNDYWLFHTVLAGVSHVLRVAPPVAGMLINFLSLGASLGAIVWLLRTVDLLPRHPTLRTCAALFVLFGANLAGSVHAALAGEPATDPVGIGTMVLSGQARSAGLFAKFLNFNGFPLGVAFFLLALAGVVWAARRSSPAALFSCAVGVLGALAFHITTGLLVLAAMSSLPLALYVIARKRPPGGRLSRKAAIVGIGLWLAGLATLTHYVVRVDDALEPGARLDLWNPENLRRFFGVIYPLLPLFAVGALHAWRTRRPEAGALVWVATVGAVAACVAVLPEENQYKFDYLAAIPMAVVALVGLRDLFSRGGTLTRAAGAVATAGVALVVTNLVVQGVAYARSDLAAQDTIAYAGVGVVGSGPNSSAWEWIAENAPADTVLVTPLVGVNRAPVLALSRRPVFVLDGGPFTAGKEEFTRRGGFVEELYGGEAVEAVDAIRAEIPNRPVIVALSSDHRDELQPVGDLVYDEDGVKLYQLRPD